MGTHGRSDTLFAQFITQTATDYYVVDASGLLSSAGVDQPTDMSCFNAL
jgi:hypothetical protein